MRRSLLLAALLMSVAIGLATSGCRQGQTERAVTASLQRPSGGPGDAHDGPAGRDEPTAVPVEVVAVERRDLASYIETNGTLEAENEVDIVARTVGPIVALEAEENLAVRRGDLLARIDPAEIQAQLEQSRVDLEEAQVAFDRAEALHAANLLSGEEYEQARSRLESARAQFSGNEVRLAYTEIRAPFDGLIVRRYVKFAENVAVGQPLFRISDFDPLLCPIQVPERALSRLARGQRAYLTVEAWPGERFQASVLRISPVIDAATGTVRVTLEVEPRRRLRPGMFASVYLETEVRRDALVIPRSALALDAVRDTVFVARDGVAERREVELGIREADWIEVLQGLSEGERVVTVGQDGLAEGTPITVLGGGAAAAGPAAGDGERP